MTNFLLLFCFLTSAFIVAQPTKIRFDYDSAGNQIVREYCINCAAKQSTVSKDVSQIKSTELQKFLDEDDFYYYPNPVKEELFLHWKTGTSEIIATIKVTSINGVVLKTIENINIQNDVSISFLEYPSGTYIIELVNLNGDQKIIKIIKQ